MAATALTEEYIEKRSIRVPWSGCQIWLGYCNPYPKHGHNQVLVHRFVMERELGRALRSDEFVMHKCDVESCINIAHLRVGSAAENSADMARKDRSSHGEKNPNAKLTVDDVLEIRRIKGTPEWSPVLLARRFGVSAAQIWNVVHRDWRRV